MSTNTWFKIGAWCWIATGAGHFFSDIAMRLWDSSTHEIDALMRAHTLDLMGTQRTYYQLMMSFSLSMGIVLVFVGVLLLYLARVVTDLRPVTTLALGMSVVSLSMSIWLDPPPPIVLFGLACIAFGVALRAPQQVRV